MRSLSERSAGARAIRAVALFEAFKGTVALLAASGLLLLVDHDLHAVAVRLVRHAHLNPAAHYPDIFIRAAEHAQDVGLSMIALGAVAYSLVRFIEAYGLLRRAAWAELFAAVSGLIYVPFELRELVHRFNGLAVAALVLNLAVVGVMLHAVHVRRRSGKG